MRSGRDFPGGSDGKVSAYDAGDLGSVSGSGGSPGEGNGNPLQYSCLENPMDRGAWWATVPGITKSQTRLSDFAFTFRGFTERGLRVKSEEHKGFLTTSHCGGRNYRGPLKYYNPEFCFLAIGTYYEVYTAARQC